jgi:large subunit ribosomal protein L31
MSGDGAFARGASPAVDKWGRSRLESQVFRFRKVLGMVPMWLPTTTRGLRIPGQSETEGIPMKQGIHPNYRDVCFVDLSNGFKFVTRSCAPTKESVKMEDGRELPLFKLETTSETHPFYTGTQKSIDSLGGRVEKFRNKFARVGLKK